MWGSGRRETRHSGHGEARRLLLLCTLGAEQNAVTFLGPDVTSHLGAVCSTGTPWPSCTPLPCSLPHPRKSAGGPSLQMLGGLLQTKQGRGWRFSFLPLASVSTTDGRAKSGAQSRTLAPPCHGRRSAGSISR